ncbi:hypothetical protein JTE90_000124 [Oedothorax gibbosus]|uniref:Tetraspanin n=1 Tax=Oedothorax gibbosus TaxID=931172 RepID=A0AAV6V2F4_9ARAC|nr:hypothetical protein JTE90_000124 [Oedothorax gibbosus]
MSSDEDKDFSEESSTDLLPTDFNSNRNYIFSCHVSENLRQIISLFLIVANFISINCGVIFIILSWYVRNSQTKQITFLQDYYQLQSVPAILLVSGIAIVLASLLGVKAAVGSRRIEDLDEAKSAAFYLFIYLVASGAVVLLVAVATFTLFGDIRVLRGALGKGLKDSMERYSRDKNVKEKIDLLQINYSCCGVEGYKDWYHVSWVDVKYLDKYDSVISSSLKGNKYYGKDVPFSCCNRDTNRPCVDTRIEDITYHSMYNYPIDLTLNTIGCRDALTNFLGHTIMLGVGLFAFLCLILWVAIMIITRYLHTSIKSMSLGNSPVGWLIPFRTKKETETSSTSSDSASDELIYSQEDSD